jgi:hypothetical protein
MQKAVKKRKGNPKRILIIKKDLGNKVFNDLPPKLTKLFVSASVKVSQFIIVQTKKVQKGNMKVSDRVGNLHCFRSDLIGSPHNGPGFDPTSRHHNGHGFVVMSPADCIDPTSSVIIRGASKLSHPQDKGVSEHATIFKVFD